MVELVESAQVYIRIFRCNYNREETETKETT